MLRTDVDWWDMIPQSHFSDVVLPRWNFRMCLTRPCKLTRWQESWQFTCRLWGWNVCLWMLYNVPFSPPFFSVQNLLQLADGLRRNSSTHCWRARCRSESADWGESIGESQWVPMGIAGYPCLCVAILMWTMMLKKHWIWGIRYTATPL